MTIKNVVIPLEIEYLQKAAKERGISRSKLVRVLMEKVVRDELVPKILSDDDLAHAEAAQRDDHHLIARRVLQVGWRAQENGLLEREPVGCADDGVRQIGGALQRRKDGDAAEDTLALNAQHRAMEVAAQFTGVAHRLVAPRACIELENQLRIAYQLIGEVLAVLEQVKSGFHQRGIGIQA